MTKMQMPGYEQKIAADAAAAERRESERVANEQRAAAEKLQNAKKKAIKKHLRPNYIKSRSLEYLCHMKNIGISAAILWLIGSGIWAKQRYGNNNGELSYKTVMQYQFAFKNAFNPDVTEQERNLGLFGTIASYLAICLLVAIFEAIARKQGRYNAKIYLNADVNDLLKKLEDLKIEGWSAQKLNSIHRECGEWLISKMSELDRGYLENLLAGGLDQANYETAVAIVTGHLKAHPNDYAEIIKKINEKTLPPEIIKKYAAHKKVKRCREYTIADEMNQVSL